MDLVLNKLERLICHKTQQTKQTLVNNISYKQLFSNNLQITTKQLHKTVFTLN